MQVKRKHKSFINLKENVFFLLSFYKLDGSIYNKAISIVYGNKETRDTG